MDDLMPQRSVVIPRLAANDDLMCCWLTPKGTPIGTPPGPQNRLRQKAERSLQVAGRHHQKSRLPSVFPEKFWTWDQWGKDDIH